MGSNPVGGIGQVAQLVEQGTSNPKVEGSIRARPIPTRAGLSETASLVGPADHLGNPRGTEPPEI
jgi:hypothetical protein